MIDEHLSAQGDLSINDDIGARLRLLRQQQGLSQRELGEPLLSGSYVSLIERGKLRPTLSMLHHFATRLSVPLPVLLGPQEDTPNKTNADTGGYSLSAETSSVHGDAGDDRQQILLLQIAALLRLQRWQEAEHLFSTITCMPLSKAGAGWYVLYSGEALCEQGRFKEAESLLAHLLAVTSPGINDDERLFHCHLHLLLGQVYRVLGHFAEARDVHRQSLGMVEKDKETALRVIIGANLAYDYVLLDDYSLATTHACFALEVLHTLMKTWDEAGCITMLAQSALHQSVLAREKGNLETARRAAIRSFELATVSRALQLQSWLRCVLAYALERQGGLAAAEREFRLAIAEAAAPQAAFDCGALVALHCCLAALLLATDKPAQAVQEVRVAQALSCMQPDDHQMQALIAITWAVLCAEQGEETTADEHFLRALRLLHERLPTGGKAGVFSRFRALLGAHKQIGPQMSELIGWWAMRAAARL
jgi:transcriptional regulator with XRE-family HTH domain